MENIPNLAKEGQFAGYGKDPIVIRNYVFGIPGGRTLDVEDWPFDVVPAGTIILKNGDDEYFPFEIAQSEATGKWVYKTNAYEDIGGDVAVAGILVASVTKDEPFAGIMTMGEVNDVAAPFGLDAVMKGIVREFLDITFGHD